MNARILWAVLLSAGLLAQAQEFSLDNLPALHNFQSHRITSADPTGGNNDFRELQPGQTLVLADIKGPGCIAHFRDNIICESYGLRAGCFPYFGVTILEEPYTTAYRWHIPDPVVFNKSVRFLIEQGNGSPPFKSGNYYYSVAYWYQTEPHAPFPKLPSPEEIIGVTPK
jgi:Protein of unknown function (DUF2961)